MKNPQQVIDHIVNWLDQYAEQANNAGFIIGISGGIDSALTSTLCALTGRKVILVNMPIRQYKDEYDRGSKHITDLKQRFPQVSSMEINLTDTFTLLETIYPVHVSSHQLAMANTRARLRMTTLYAIGQANHCLVAGTGNKVEDFGVGFFTKYGDGGVDISPIADINKSEVRSLAKFLDVIPEILSAKPTDGLWGDGRSDEDQLGASYEELEWAMNYNSADLSALTSREKEVLAIYNKLHAANKHKMIPIPVCLIPNHLKEN